LRHPVDTLHLLAHGRSGAFRFGDKWIDAEALKAHASDLASWGVETIALWSCRVGADANFVALLEELTGARVLASAEWLGRDGGVEQSQLGDWRLSDLVEREFWPAQFRLEDLDDELIGSDSADELDGGAGADELSGGIGDDQDEEVAPVLIEGIDQTTEADDDTIDAGRGANEIDAGLGDDRVDAGAGDDLVDGGAGDDALDGGKGDDVLIGGFGDDTFKGGAGEDIFDLTQGNDVVTDFDPEEGDRIVLPDGQSFELIERGDDLLIRMDDGSTRVLEGISREEFDRYVDEALVSDDLIQPVETEISLTEGDDDFVPETASDASLKVEALSGNDQVSGGDGDDTLDGGRGDDTLRGGAGADRLLGRAGDDLLIGGDGGDTYVLTRGNDTIEGFSLADDRVLVRKGQLYATEEIDDERGQGLLIKLFDDDENPRTDDPKSSTLLLGIGKGQLQAHNVLIRDGDLEVPYSDEGDIQSVIRGSNQGDATVKTANGEDVSGKGRLNGTDKSDVIAGRGGDDQLSGGGGDDILTGGEGRDTLLGGRGDDWLSGGGDGDVYILSRGNDTIDGFNADRDRIAILEDQQYRAEETSEGLLVHLVDPDDQSIEHTTLFAGVVKADLSIDNLIQIDSTGKRVFNSFSVEVDADESVEEGDAVGGIHFTADNASHLYLNGRRIGETWDWKRGFEIDVSDGVRFREGMNVLAIAAWDGGQIAGINGRFEMPDGTTFGTSDVEEWKVWNADTNPDSCTTGAGNAEANSKNACTGLNYTQDFADNPEVDLYKAYFDHWNEKGSSKPNPSIPTGWNKIGFNVDDFNVDDQEWEVPGSDAGNPAPWKNNTPDPTWLWYGDRVGGDKNANNPWVLNNLSLFRFEFECDENYCNTKGGWELVDRSGAVVGVQAVEACQSQEKSESVSFTYKVRVGKGVWRQDVCICFEFHY
jgi:Ca2+-binding RTX toxin-like protein